METSFIDWPGKIASVVFLPGCNFRCGWCHNRTLVLHPERIPDVPLSHVLQRMKALKGWVDGVVITGGEPTVAPKFPVILDRFNQEGIPVKLDTNGARPDILEKFLVEKRLTGISMDIKGVLEPEMYRTITGVSVDIQAIRRSVQLIAGSGLWHEFRTTLLPGIHTRADIDMIARQLEGLVGGKLQRPLKLQGFKPNPELSEPWRSLPEVTVERFLETE
ncbi:MAG: anaerobic ribonucleoside-triphosphate reductase activating protein [bacterium]